MSACVRPEAESANIYVKLEGYNPTGSIKDRAYLYMIRGRGRTLCDNL
jgi:cysteine synthase